MAGLFDDVGANPALLRDRLRQAFIVNAAYLALSPPTQAQAVQQVERLTREFNALLRLLAGQTDDTDDS